MKEKACELRQKRAGLVDEMRTMVERAEKESRDFTKEEKEKFDAHEAESRGLAERISRIERIDAVDKNGPEPEGRRSDPLPHEDPANAKGRKFSMMRAVKCLAERRAVDGLEGEVSAEIAKRSGKSPQGFFIPAGSSVLRRTVAGRARAEKRALDTTAGTGSVPTILEADWIELLRNRMVTMQAGAREIRDLVGKFAIPRQNAAATAYWVAESGAPTGSNQTLDQVLFTPHTIGAYTDISRRFFELTILDSGEEFVKEDLTKILAIGGDLAALNGPGTNAPTGILQNSAITQTVALGADGGSPTFGALVNLETQVARANADMGTMAYITNADGRGTCKTTAKIGSTFPVFLWEDDEMNGYPAFATQQLPNNLTKGTGTNLSPILFGNWSDLIFAYWSGVDILVDPYTGSSSGTVRVVALMDMDIQVRHPQSFAYINDMISDQS